MARINSPPGDGSAPRIARDEVKAFFETRSRKIETLGPVRAVIYQDKHPDLAERRDAAEKQCLLPLLALDGGQRLLDVGCGTGRWARELVPRCSHYHGIDFSEGLVAHARRQYAGQPAVRFTVASADDYSMESLDETQRFDRILCSGVLIYLNDDEVVRALRCMAEVSAPACRLIIREPLATPQRLTIYQHFSNDMNQQYNAIYRTEEELRAAIDENLCSAGFRLLDAGDVYSEPALNNRAETRQRWLLMERKA